MVIVYFDCFSGIAGDMILGALLDLGVPTRTFINELTKIKLDGYSIKIQRVTRNHISALDVIIKVTEPQPHRTLSDIKKIITESTLSKRIQKTSFKIFKRLANAEGKIHHIPSDKVHFHEVGAVDSIIDIIGSVILFDYHNIKQIYSSPLPLGKGFIDCDHGKLPLPAPATLELLKNVPVYESNRNQELVTPTGAAIITTLATSFGGMPQMKVEKIGYGAGKIESDYPNLLRIYLGKIDTTKRK
jgi:uncharacterized protein (TIGR00299 family) protein